MPDGHAEPRLVADIGGTHARLALETAQGLSRIRTLACDDYPTLYDALQHYLRDVGSPAVRHGAMGIATPVQGDSVHMTNHAWAFSIADLRRQLGWSTLLVLNDFTALALALPHLPSTELQTIGGAAPMPGQPMGLIGPGTGLGVSGLIPVEGAAPIALAGEGGHASFAPQDANEVALWRFARERFGHVSTERIVSGPGLQLIHDWLCDRDGQPAAGLTPAQITQRGCDASDARCAEAVAVFCAALGTAAADLALTLGARGGIYIGGGIVPRLGPCFACSPFRRRFEDKGRFRAYLESIPVSVIHSRYPALIGAAQALARHLHAPDSEEA